MKKAYKYYIGGIIILSILCTFQSCVSLEEDVSSILTVDNLKSEADIIAALTPIYRTYNEIVYLPHEQQVVCYGGDDITTWWGGNKAPLRVFDRFDYGDGQNSNILWLDLAWNRYWRVIYYANSLIDGLKTSTAPEEVVSVGEGEARFFRALAYFNLVRSWGNVPEILDGVIATGKEERTTVLSNYNIIENDLLLAETLLPEPGEISAEMIGRVSKAAAKTLLADLYLTWAGWPVKDVAKYSMAASKAKEVIDMDYFELLPIDELWLLENQNSLESVFAIQFSKSENITSRAPTDNSFHEARGYSDMYPERQFFYDFPAGPRKDATFLLDIPQRIIVNGVIVPGTPATKPWQQSQRNHPMYKKFTIWEDLTMGDRTVGFRAWEVMRYAEVLLIYAEASARASGGNAPAEALEALNQVKRRAAGYDFLTPEVSVDVTSATADEILAEKGWELAGEYKRWFDLVRTEKVGEITAKRDPTEEVPLAISAASITWKQYIAPIPESTILTSSLIQNPAGFKAQ